jgi:hypothetical protein
MKLRLFRMGLEGKVAVANLSLLGCALIVMFGPQAWMNEGSLAVAGVAYVVAAVLTFPAGWMAAVYGPPLLVFAIGAIMFPLNAYLWGYTVAAFVRWIRRRADRRATLGDTGENA